jgi:hypothetical protein
VGSVVEDRLHDRRKSGHGASVWDVEREEIVLPLEGKSDKREGGESRGKGRMNENGIKKNKGKMKWKEECENWKGKKEDNGVRKC